MPITYVRSWDEAKHPRGPGGKFTEVPGLETKWGKGKRGSVRHDTLTAKMGGRKAGHIRLTDSGSEIDELQVTPDKRGRGIASQLMREAIAKFGHQTMRLHASPVGKGGMDRKQLMEFYAKFGFEPEPARGEGYMVRKPDSQRSGQSSIESRRRKSYDNGELKEYWTKDPEGLAKWAGKPHPWTSLYKEISEHVKNKRKAKAITSAWYREVFGHMPNEKPGRSVSDRYWNAPSRINTPKFLTGVDGFTKGRPVADKDMTMEECQAAYEDALAAGDVDKAAKMKAKMDAMKGQRAKFGEGPGGSQQGLSIKAIKAQIKQATEDGDEEMVAKLKAKLAKLTGRSRELDDADERAKWNPADHPRGPGGRFIGVGGGKVKSPSGKTFKPGTKTGIKDRFGNEVEEGDRVQTTLGSKGTVVGTKNDPYGNKQIQIEWDGTGQTGTARPHEFSNDMSFDLMRNPNKRRSADPDRAAVARSLPVIRSAHAAASLIDEPSEIERDVTPDGGVFVRASYRAGRSNEASDIMTLRFSAFNNWYEIDSAREGKFLERVAPGAFTKTIGERGGQIKVLFNHGKDNQIGEKILGKIITLEERKDGAYAEIELFDTSYNRDLIPSLRAGAYGSSFMFNVMDDQWEDRPERSSANPGGLPERTVRSLRLLELGPVTWPANPDTTAGLRSDTDTYCDGLRATAPEIYNDLEERFGEFRSALPRTSDDEAAYGTFEDEAATRDEAPVDIDHADHAEQPETNSAETRRARLIFAGVINED